MEYRNLGNSGLQVSLAGLGCNNFGMRIDAAQTRAVVHRALDEGLNFFDTADIYGNRGQSEEMLVKALGARRRDIVLASKFGMKMADGPYGSGASRRYIVTACEASLRRLATDYIDLYQIHTPDPATPEHATLERLDEFAGKRGHSLLELAVCWLAAQPMVASVICGATRPEQVAANVKAMDWKLDPEELKQVHKLTSPK